MVNCHCFFFIIIIFSLGVALSKGHGKFFFRGNVTVEEGRKSSLILYAFVVPVSVFS